MRPRLEVLEDRLTPAVATWTGAGTNNLWSNPANWAGQDRPGIGDDLVFPDTASRKNTVNDFADGRNVGSITFEGSGYVLSGNRIDLRESRDVLINLDGTNTIALDINLGSPLFPERRGIHVEGSELRLTGQIDGGPLVTIQKFFSGQLTLSGANTFGSFFEVGGPLRLEHSSALGTPGGVVLGNTSIFGELELAGGITVPERLFLFEGAIASVTGSNVLTGKISLADSISPFSVAAGSELRVDGVIKDYDPLEFSDLVALFPEIYAGLFPPEQPPEFWKIGDGKLTLGAANAYAGPTQVVEGTLAVSHALALGTAENNQFDATFVHKDAAVELANGAVVQEMLRLEGVAGQPATLRGVGGAGGTWTGPIVSPGPARLVAVQTTSNTPGRLTVSGKISAMGVTVVGGGLGHGVVTLSGPQANAISSTTVESGTLALSKPSGVVAVGSLTIAGRVLLGNSGQLAPNQPLIIDSGTLDTNGQQADISGLAMIGGSIVGTGTLTLRGNLSARAGPDGEAIIASRLNLDGDVRVFSISTGFGPLGLLISGVISNGGLFKELEGTLELSGSNTYTGPTTVNGGTLLVNGSQANSPVIVNAGGTLGGSGTVGPLTVDASGTVSPAGNGLGILSIQGDADFQPGSTLRIQLSTTVSGSGHDALDVSGALTLADSTLLLSAFKLGSAVGDRFTILGNDGTDAVLGTFAGLREGSIIDLSTPLGPGPRFAISYQGGGNDVVLTQVNTPTKAEDLAVTPAELDEGGRVVLTGHLTDSDPLDRLTLVVDYNDGSPVEEFHPGRDPFALRHRYRDDGAYVIHVTWFDEHGQGNSADLPVTVRNVAPLVRAGGDEVLHPGGVLHRAGSFRDPGADAWTATVDYGDGSGPQPLRLGKDGHFRLRHRYRDPGTYTVTVTVTDDDGGVGSDTFTVTVRPRRRR